MRLDKKTEEHTKPKVDHNKKIPYGKFQGKTVGWLLANEKWYCDWMDKEGLWEKWKLYETGATKKVREVNKDGLPREYKLPGVEEYTEPPPWEETSVQSTPAVKKPPPYVAADGTIQVGIREVEVPPKENKWIKEATSLLSLLYLENISESLKESITELLHMPVE
jgi:hypothetical protein